MSTGPYRTSPADERRAKTQAHIAAVAERRGYIRHVREAAAENKVGLSVEGSTTILDELITAYDLIEKLYRESLASNEVSTIEQLIEAYNRAKSAD